MKYIISLFLIASVFCPVKAQQISGTIYGNNPNGSRETLPSANVHWEGTQQGVSADLNGNFSIERPAGGNNRLIASFIGFRNDTIEVPAGTNHVEFDLWEGFMLGEAVVSVRRRGNYISRINPIQTETITTGGLQKMACCNLAESFENSAAVTVGFADAVSGARQIQMLGLSGIYTQMLDENIPTLRGLSSIFGWNYVPGPWLQALQISKGSSSVVNGFESTTGQINMDFKQPNDTEALFINLFASDDRRLEANITSATPVSNGLWTGLMIHGSRENMEHDKNNDSFLDMPKTQQINLYNRWVYENHEKMLESRTGFKFVYDEREGGQKSEIAHPRYQIDITNRNFNVFNKTGFAFGSREGQSIGIINAFTYHELNSAYGAKSYDGKQNSLYSNVLVSTFISNTFHQIVTGGSFKYDRIDEHFSDTLTIGNTERESFSFVREEYVPGVFAQYTYSGTGRITFIVGLRGDYHNRFGMRFTPRTNIKFDITENIIFRASAGRGFRSPNVISDNIGFLASSRHYSDLQSIKNLSIEKAWNYGANLTFFIPMHGNEPMSVSLDYYRTDFKNQAIMDMEFDSRRIYFYNLRDYHRQAKSYANAWQVDINATLFRGFDVYAAFRMNETKVTYSLGETPREMEKPLTSKYRGLLNLSYATNFQKWKIDVTAQLNGSARLPGDGYFADEQRSPAYPLYFAQITRKTKRLDIYIGCENILDYKQPNPIINADNPFGAGFDASQIWGPLMGRKFYAGIRLTLGELK